VLPIASGGTGSATQPFVDLTTNQTLQGVKSFASPPVQSGAGIAAGTIPLNALATQPVASVTGTAPIVSSGGTNPALSITNATTAAAGAMSAAQFKKLGGLWLDAVADGGADPSGATDSTNAINTLIAQLNASTFGGVLYFPVGFYLIGSSLTAITQTSVRVIGQSRTNTIIYYTVPTGDMFSVTGWYDQFEELQFQGLNTTIASGSSSVAFPISGGVLNVASTANFANSGSIYVATNSTATAWQLISYTGKTATSFTGCTGGTGTAAATGGYVLGRTSGYAINHSGGNYALVRHCEFNSNFNIINFAGQDDHVDDINSRNFAGTLVQISGTNQNLYFNHVFAENPCQATAGIACSTNLGSLLIDNSGMSQCGITLDLNPGAGVTIPTVYVSNTFFDTGTYGVRFRGSGSIYRCLFVNSWFSSHTNHGASIEQANVDGIDWINCHFFGNSGWGIYASGGGTRWSVNGGCKFAGNTSGAVYIAPSVNSNSQVRITGNTLGPTAAFGANGVGVQIAAGTYTSLTIQQNDVSGNTGAGIIDGSTAVGTKIIKDNIGAMVQGGVVALTTASQAATTTEAQVVGYTIPAYALQIGTTFRIRVIGQDTTTTAAGTATFRLRIGTASLTGAIAASFANTSVVGTAIGFTLEIIATVKAIGASGGIEAIGIQQNSAATGLTATATVFSPANGTAPANTAVNTTVQNVLEFNMLTSATTSLPTVYLAEIEVIR
jgi:hypothetical protein